MKVTKMVEGRVMLELPLLVLTAKVTTELTGTGVEAAAAAAVAPTSVSAGNAVNGSAAFVDGQDWIKADAMVKTALGESGVPAMLADTTSRMLARWTA